MSRKSKAHKLRRQQNIERELSDSLESSRKVKRQRISLSEPDSTTDEDEQVRSWGRDEELSSNKLPVMSQTGKWKTIKGATTESTEETQVAASNGEDDSDLEQAPSTVQKSYEEVRAELASVAIVITEEAEENIGRLREMLQYADPNRHSIQIVRLALISTLAVIKDVLPGYYIRPLKDAEKTIKVSKDIKKTRSFEESMLSSYKKFFEILKGIVQPKKRRIPKRLYPVLMIALSCLHELMLFAGHFNYFEDILKVVAHSLTLYVFPEAIQKSSQAFRRLFETDEQGYSTMLGVRLISNMIKELSYDCPVIWLKALETVRIKAESAGRMTNPKGVLRTNNKRHLSGREKKELKAKQEEMKKMAEAEAIVTKEELNKWNSETLKYLFRVYFGILKSSPKTELLPPILAGLARHSHRIGVEYFVDLLQSLKRLLETNDGLDLVASLHCILTVDRIHSINENLSAMDLKFFYNCLFRQLGRLIREPNHYNWDSLQIPLQSCLNTLFHPKRIIPAVRSSAFVQKLADTADAFLDAGLAGPAVFMIDNMKTILTHHNKAQSVLDREPFGQGVYLKTCDDPDLCNPYTRSLYDVLVAIKNKDNKRGKLPSLIDSILKLGDGV